ncbi:MAG: hypothetical protein OEV55_08990 [candidate division Zixibacteria bacterium]|nr:hypothetical protein [candidate division Zixibacteria bacterium]
MSRLKKKEIGMITEKPCWHPYKLQSLSLKRFIKVVNKILQQELEIIDIRKEKEETGD